MTPEIDWKAAFDGLLDSIDEAATELRADLEKVSGVLKGTPSYGAAAHVASSKALMRLHDIRHAALGRVVEDCNACLGLELHAALRRGFANLSRPGASSSGA